MQTSVVALVQQFRLDYTNSVLSGLSAYLTKRHQSVLNAAARPTYGLRRHNHITDALMTLHWQRIPKSIRFRLTVLVRQVLHGIAPSYLGPLLHPTAVPERLSLRSASYHHVIVPPLRLSTVGAMALLVHDWTDYLEQFAGGHHLCWSLPVFRLRLDFFCSPFVTRRCSVPVLSPPFVA